MWFTKRSGLLWLKHSKKYMQQLTLSEDNQQIFASKYKLYMPTEEELKRELVKEQELWEIENKF